MNGYCVQCDKNFDDIQSHLDNKNLQGHKGREPLAAEIVGRTIWCPACHNDVRVPRSKTEKGYVPKHVCDPAKQQPDGHWTSPDGRNQSVDHLTIDPDPSEFD